MPDNEAHEEVGLLSETPEAELPEWLQNYRDEQGGEAAEESAKETEEETPVEEPSEEEPEPEVAEEEPAEEGPETVTVDGVEYDQEQLQNALKAKTTLDDIFDQFNGDPVNFFMASSIKRGENGDQVFALSKENARELAHFYAQYGGLDVIDQATADDYKPDPAAAAKREAAAAQRKTQELEAKLNQQETDKAWANALTKVGITYNKADEGKVTHPRNVAYNIWLRDKNLTPEQALRKVLAESTLKNKEAEVKTKSKPDVRPTPPKARTVAHDPFDPTSEVSEWVQKFRQGKV